MSGVPTAEELRESAREAWRNAPRPARNDDEFEERWLSRHLADALAELELLHQADCAPSFHLLQRAEAAEAEVARLRTFFAYSEESIWKQRAEAAEAKLRDTYCARCHERMYP